MNCILGQKLIEAVKANDIEEVKRLIEAGADINAKNKDGGTALSYALIAANLEIVKLLIETGVDCGHSKDILTYICTL